MADPWDAFSPAKPPPKQNVLAQAKQTLTHLENTPAMKALQEFAQLPAEGVNALLGAPQRAIAARLAQFTRNPRGVAETTLAPALGPLALLDPAMRQQAGHEVYAAFHPNDPNIQANAQHAVGVDRLKGQGRGPLGRARNFAVDMAFQTLTDPLTYTGAGTAEAGERGLQAMGRAGTRALTHPNDIIRGTAKNILTNVPEREGGFGNDLAVINTLRQRAITRARVKHTADEALLAKHQKVLKTGEIPDPVRQRLLEEPYVYGTPEMRAQALAMGYKPTKTQATTPPAGLLTYDLRENYDPHTGMFKAPGAFNDLLLGEEESLRAPKAGMEMPQKGEADPATLPDRLAKRLAQSRAVIRHRETQAALQQHLGISPEMASSLATDTKVGGFPALKALSRAQVDALLTTGLPHMRNVGVGGYLSMGEPGMIQALRYFISGNPALARRIEEGGSAHFGSRTPGRFSPARLLPSSFRKISTGMLDRFDQAVRMARLEQLDKTNPGLSEFEKLDRVNQDIGAYNLKPQYVKFLQGIGANFPQWHNYVVPTMVGRAVMRNPGRVERLARAEQLANDDFAPNSTYRMTLGGPLDESASAAADIARVIAGKGVGGKYPTYFGGPSSLGPIAHILHPSGASIGVRAAQTASSVVPFGNLILDMTLNPYKSPLPELGRAAAGVAGVYTQKRTPGSMARTAKKQVHPQQGADPWAAFHP